MELGGIGMDDYRVRLIELARDLAGPMQDEAAFLRRFRAIYQHLAVTVETSAGGAQINPMAMGMDPFMRTPEQVTELLDRSDANLRELGG
jgi:hypothetical protein